MKSCGHPVPFLAPAWTGLLCVRDDSRRGFKSCLMDDFSPRMGGVITRRPLEDSTGIASLPLPLKMNFHATMISFATNNRSSRPKMALFDKQRNKSGPVVSKIHFATILANIVPWMGPRNQITNVVHRRIPALILKSRVLARELDPCAELFLLENCKTYREPELSGSTYPDFSALRKPWTFGTMTDRQKYDQGSFRFADRCLPRRTLRPYISWFWDGEVVTPRS